MVTSVASLAEQASLRDSFCVVCSGLVRVYLDGRPMSEADDDRCGLASVCFDGSEQMG